MTDENKLRYVVAHQVYDKGREFSLSAITWEVLEDAEKYAKDLLIADDEIEHMFNIWTVKTYEVSQLIRLVDFVKTVKLSEVELMERALMQRDASY